MEGVVRCVLRAVEGELFGGWVCPTDKGPRGEATGAIGEETLELERAWETVEAYAAEKLLEAGGGWGLVEVFIL